MLSKLYVAILDRFTGEDGQALSEYGLVLGLIAVVCIIALTAIGLAISGDLDSLSGAMGGGGSP